MYVLTMGCFLAHTSLAMTPEQGVTSREKLLPNICIQCIWKHGSCIRKAYLTLLLRAWPGAQTPSYRPLVFDSHGPCWLSGQKDSYWTSYQRALTSIQSQIWPAKFCLAYHHTITNLSHWLMQKGFDQLEVNMFLNKLGRDAQLRCKQASKCECGSSWGRPFNFTCLLFAQPTSADGSSS